MKYYKLLLVIILLTGCHNHQEPSQNHNHKEKLNKNTTDGLSKEDVILAKAIEAYGGDKYANAHYNLVFRKKNYSFKNDGENFRYEVKSTRADTIIMDILENGKFTRTINDQTKTLSPKEESKYSNALNSVIYFATLPYKLNDKAVNKEYKGTTNIKKKLYDILKITFDQIGGGVDHDDVFYYWIGRENNQIDYLAYSYHVNKGGVRFRTAQNKRNVDGIIFQDYINYKAEVGTPLDELPQLWEENKLKKLSEILTEDVVQIDK